MVRRGQPATKGDLTMTDALTEQQRRQATAYGPSLALRRQRRAAMGTGRRETLDGRAPRPVDERASALAELEFRAHQLELLSRGSG
jgi:hypothetical protein